MKQLILGGVRSGKSRLAEQRAKEVFAEDKQLIYIATGSAGDHEMAQRIEQHRRDREAEKLAWVTVEEPIALAEAVEMFSDKKYIVLIDCLTLWISNCLHEDCWDRESNQFLNSLESTQAEILLVSNEVGSGIVPLGELSRKFADECGRLHQSLSGICDVVTLVVAGLPLELKSSDVTLSGTNSL